MFKKSGIAWRHRINLAIFKTRKEMVGLARDEAVKEGQRVAIRKDLKVDRLNREIEDLKCDIKERDGIIIDLKKALKKHRTARIEMEVQRDLLQARNARLQAALGPLQRLVGENDYQIQETVELEKKDNRLKEVL